MAWKPTAKVQIENLQVEYERFFQVSLDMLCISSYDGHFKKVNPAFAATLGFSSEELCTKSYLDFIHPDDIKKTTEEVGKQLETKQKVFNFENRYRCKDGSYKWLSWKSAPVNNFMYAAARDITESKLAKAELEMINQELAAFTHSIAHDLRSPLRSISGLAYEVLEDEGLSQESKKNLSRITLATKRMSLLIEGLLDLSRFSKQSMIKEPVNLSEIANEVIEELQNGEPDRKVEFVIEPNLTDQGDAVLLKAVLTNLLGNAWKYSSKCTRAVKIEFGKLNDDYFVRDNGNGFDMKYADKLFTVFQRLHSQSQFEGSGIGLATVQRIIKRHGGRIWATGAPDQGATFYFCL